MNRWLSALRPSIRLLARQDEFVFVGRSEFKVAPILWYNDQGQVAAVGNETGRAYSHLRRVDLLRQDQVLGCEGEQGKAAVLFMRYAIAVVLEGEPLRQWLRPRLQYCEDDRSLSEFGRSRDERIRAFGTVARRAGVVRVTSCADPAV